MGRPRIETDQNDLLQAICDIVLHSRSADNKRKTEAIRSCRTLDKLHEELNSIGYNLSRSATYLRLIPRNSSSIEGKRHVPTVPVKLCRAQADHHRRIIRINISVKLPSMDLKKLHQFLDQSRYNKYYNLIKAIIINKNSAFKKHSTLIIYFVYII